VDILVELDRPVGWEIVDLHEYLEELLGVAVDLVTLGAVVRKPLLWDSIREDLTYVEA
jgi:predicted nucleotidyltransferase